jgi:uncharacterized protein
METDVMTPEERQLLNGLFERMNGAADAPRDREAESFIADQVRAKPYAPYLLSQTVIIQEEALKAAAGRIQELENQLKEREQQGGGSFLGGLGRSVFGGGDQRPTSVPRAGGPWGAPPQQSAPVQQPSAGPWGAPQGGMGGGGGFGGGAFGGGGGGGFLRSAMTTAAGVAGGALLYQGISSLFGGHHASSLLSDASQGLTGQAGALNDQFFGDNSVLGGATPATGADAGWGGDTPTDTASFVDDSDTDVDAGSDDSSDFGGDDSGGDWA